MAVLVLKVDDEVQVARALERVLRRHGYLVRTANSATQALTCLEGVHIVITDVRMPGMSGIDLVETVRRLHPAVRCALMSGYEGADEPRGDGFGDGFGDGATDVARFPKPWDQQSLLSKLAELAAPP
jgi:DNA-binding NtrC family response regulator